MKKILLATSALVASASFAAADAPIVSGSAQMGFEYAENNTGDDETTVNTEVTVTFSMSGETDGGLSFGAETNYLVEHQGAGPVNDDTWVWVSGAFGKLSMGDIGEADQVAGLSDIGLDGLGTDNVAEALSGDDLTGEAHDMNYTYTGGPLTVAVSGNIGAGTATADHQSWAIGGKYNFGNMYVGLGYADHSEIPGVEDHSSTSAFIGGTFDAIKVAAMYTMADPASGDLEAYGVTVDYTIGATTITGAYSDNDLSTDASYGVGASYDLGGGASVVGAVGSINDQTKADFGIKMSF